MTRQEISDDVWSVMEPLMPTVTGRSRLWTDHRLALEGGVEVPHRGAVAGRAGAVREVELDLQAVQPLGRGRHLTEAVGRGADAGRRPAGKIDRAGRHERRRILTRLQPPDLRGETEQQNEQAGFPGGQVGKWQSKSEITVPDKLFNEQLSMDINLSIGKSMNFESLGSRASQPQLITSGSSSG